MERLPSKRVRHVLALVDKLSATSKKILTEKKLLLAKDHAAMGSQDGEGKDIMQEALLREFEEPSDRKPGNLGQNDRTVHQLAPKVPFNLRCIL